MNLKRSTGISFLLIALMVFSGGWFYSRTFAKGDDFYESIIRFDDVFKKIKTNYVVDVPAESLLVYAINYGMRDILDPHTSYFEEKDYDNLMIHTKGEFGGLGITIGVPDNILTVIAPLPIPNSPAMKAGLMAGDRILKIDGKTTEGIELDAAVNKLRGPKGTLVKLSIGREGVLEPFEVELERDIIKINSVEYAGIVDAKNKIGYIKLVSFTQTTSQEMDEALKQLNAKGIQSLVLDLRSNPGGLLKEAVGVSEKFLPAGKLVVYTQGRNPSQKVVFESTAQPVLPDNIPLVVLVSPGSASASEIVAGAIQDHDRGVIMGNETFGKGSVQTILPLEQKHALKLTTAYYYTPSGRCINKLSNEVGEKRHAFAQKEDEEDASGRPDSLKAKDTKKKEEFKTLRLGRTVYGGGGITPDLDVALERYTPLEREFASKQFLFKFASSELAKQKAQGGKNTVPDTFRATDQTYNAFLAYLKTNKFEYTSPEQTLLKELHKTLDNARKDPYDSTKVIPAGPNDPTINRAIADLDSAINRDKEYALVKNKDMIKDRLTQAFLTASVNKEAYYDYVLKKDRYVLEAKKVLLDSKQYERVLKKDFRKSGI
ncbi:MAG: S41 family peptidase [Fibrobacterota bacterium]